jgi:peptide deformylase
MSILKLVTVPSKLLSQKSEPIQDSEFGEELDKFMSDMAETMYAFEGVGLAGVQVGKLKTILVADLGYATGLPYGQGSVKMVNPRIVESSSNMISIPEGCLSYPGLETSVDRADKIKVEYFTPLGERREEEFTNLAAIVLQHEMDHFVGTTLLSRSSSFKRQRYEARLKKEMQRYLKANGYEIR